MSLAAAAFYESRRAAVQLLAIAHQRRRPGYWQHRDVGDREGPA